MTSYLLFSEDDLLLFKSVGVNMIAASCKLDTHFMCFQGLAFRATLKPGP